MVRPQIEGRGPCEPFIAQYAQEKKNLKKYSFGEKIVYTSQTQLSISIDDASQVEVGSVLEDRLESFDTADLPRDYDNILEIEKNKIDALVNDANTTYSNQYGFCYRNLIEISGLSITPYRLKVDCDAVANDQLVFKKD